MSWRPLLLVVAAGMLVFVLRQSRRPHWYAGDWIVAIATTAWALLMIGEAW